MEEELHAAVNLLPSPLRLPQPQPEPSDAWETGVTGASDAIPVLWMLALLQQSRELLRAIITSFPAQLTVMEPPVGPSLVPSQNYRPRSLTQVPISPLDMGMVWSRASPGLCQRTVIKGSQWSPGLQGADGEGLAEPCSKEEDGQPS